MRLLGIGRAAEHLADSLDDGVPVDAVDLEQLVRFAAARNVRHGQTMHSEAGLVNHGRGHCLTKAPCGRYRNTDSVSAEPLKRIS